MLKNTLLIILLIALILIAVIWIAYVRNMSSYTSTMEYTINTIISAIIIGVIASAISGVKHLMSKNS